MTEALPAIAVAGPLVPAETIRAHGFEPVELTPLASDAGALSAGVCAAARGWATAVEVAEPCLSAAVLTTRCDQLRRESETLRERVKLPLFIMNIPATHGTEAARRQYQDEVARLDRFLAQVPRIIVGSAGALARNHVGMAASAGEGARAPDYIHHRVGLLGCCLTDADAGILSLLHAAGLRIAVDALEHPFAPPPLLRQRPNALFFEHLRTLGSEHSLDGWVLLRQTWCDLYHAEEIRLKQSTGLPLLALATGAQPALEALRTRVEAFAEQLDAVKGGGL